MTTHIQQRGYADCGVACIAMICNVDYERVIASVPPDVYFHGLYAGEVIHAIKKISKRKFGYVEIPSLSFDDYFKALSIIRTEILIVNRSGHWDEITKVHYIYVNPVTKKIYDPVEDEVIDFNYYINRRQDWEVIGTIHESFR